MKNRILNLLPKRISYLIRATVCLGYIPSLKKPVTFNEKIQYRKKFGEHDLFSVCSDKFKVKDYVSDKVGKKFVIENYFVGKDITVDALMKIVEKHGAVVAKLNHDSGSVYLVDKFTSTTELKIIVEALNKAIYRDYGIKSGESWYSKIDAKIIIEKQLDKDVNGELPDYKFHVFTTDSDQKVVLHVDFDRYSNHTRSWFDEELNCLPFAMGYPNIKTNIEAPRNYPKMVEISKALAKPFSYARVDLYNVNGDIYFGEITFAHGSGFERFTTKYHDKWMGNFWKGELRK